MTTPSKTLKLQIEQFMHHFLRGVEEWIKAGKLLVEMQKVDRHVNAYILAHDARMVPGILRNLEDIGRDKLHPYTLFIDGPIRKGLHAMSYSDQLRLIVREELIPVVVDTPTGTDIIMMKLKNATHAQKHQLITPGGKLRDVGEQGAFRLSEKTRLAAKDRRTLTCAYELKCGRVFFKTTTGVLTKGFTAKELAIIISLMSK